MKKILDENHVKEFLDLPVDDYQSIIRGVRPEHMDYDTYKQHMRTLNKLSRIRRQYGVRSK